MKQLLGGLLAYLRSRALSTQVRASSDAELLTRFSAEQAEEAFAALVCRHGPMVWCVCRRLLGNEADAEDAFQATFLVLARKARSLRRQDLLAGWLHGVACRTALAIRSAAARRRRRERQAQDVRAAVMTDTGMNADHASWSALRPVLDIELRRLPERYRAPIVLCDLEGKSRQEAAELLHLAEGTLSSRLARGRRLLARRLSRYAPTVSGGSVAAVLASDVAATVPAAVMTSTIRAAGAFAVGPAAAGLISSRAAIVAEGVLKMMFLSKVKAIAGVVMAAALACTGAALFASGMLGGGPLQAPAPPPAAAVHEKPKPPDAATTREPIRRKEEPQVSEFEPRGRTEPELEILFKEELASMKTDFRALGRERVKAAKEVLAANWALFEQGPTWQKGNLQALTISLLDSTNKVLAAELEMATTRMERLAALERHWLLARKIEVIGESNWRSGRLAPQDYYPLKYHRIDAQFKLLKAREGK